MSPLYGRSPANVVETYLNVKPPLYEPSPVRRGRHWSELDVAFHFINCCLNSSSEIVNCVARMVFFSRMRSPTGSNALHCRHRCGARANDISIINSSLINRYVPCRYSDELISRASALLELIVIRDHSFNLS